ncbi:hypothetical protein BDZ97DRAFT_1737811 [Flammula alnicola]|nr:hypothetical protein BDZ97DRAFT_1738212 [Flammula alnicola]KAF8957162.1 hypothetical protein BDZ97DRAFT_1737811 [Flammula alnicola]
MAHNQNDSLNSLSSLTSVTTLSSRASVKAYEELKEYIAGIEQGQIKLPELVDAAEKIVSEKFAPHPQKTYVYKKASEKVSVNLDAVMRAMLAHAEGCGGEGGKRYVASAIVACGKKGDDEAVVAALTALGITWLTHLLFIFKTSRSHENQPNREPSGAATPSLEETTSHIGKGVGHRAASFKDDVLVRDGYECVITGMQHISHPAPRQDFPQVTLKACHILRRAVATFDDDTTSAFFKSAATTFDILVNFTRLSVETLEELESCIDDASNGIMLQGDIHDGFDIFDWCLKPTQVDNEYTVKIFTDRRLFGFYGRSADALVTFRDRSGEFRSSKSQKRVREIALPDPHLISIHAAIAGILHMSGAGKFFDELLDRYQDKDRDVPPVRSWPDLEKVIGEEALRDSVTATLAAVGVH